ncbi:ribonuclease 1-like [Quercus lobata]|uniref:ribonuclease 1-like n=1 Tax=Quercus lobata TaxID=97700 RepID=UPI001247AD6C|nr:ribonuclease 1-like [Quercus lobata]
MSGTKMAIFLLLSLVLVVSTESMAAPGGGSSQTVSYDELLLAFQWPTSYCNTGMNKCNHPIPLEFTVHGLWLNKNSNSVNCPTPNPRIKLYRQIRSDLRKDLEKYWPNLNSQGRREYLWEHEYEKHGYCFTEFGNHVDYFRTALAIATDIGDVKNNMLLSSEKTITRGEFYQVKDFKHVTIAGRKLTLGLRCNYARNSAIPQLHELVFCTDRNKILKDCAYNVKECDRPWKDSNGVVQSGRFKFP